jgi:NitT/TauT family transport system permease protein
MPSLDVLQSVPILSFLPVVLLGLSAVLPEAIAAGLASIILIFTSQAWNMTFAWYQSLTTIPVELREASSIFRFNRWLRLRTLELPFGANSLIWNSMMSWAGGWFFLMAAEIFTVGARDFRLPGLGAYLQTAASAGNFRAVLMGVATLVLTIVLLDQLLWRPLLTWADRFKLEMVAGEEAPRSWVLDLLSSSWLVAQIDCRLWGPFTEWLDARVRRRVGIDPLADISVRPGSGRFSWRAVAVAAVVFIAALYGAARAAEMLSTLPISAWARVGAGLMATLMRVAASLAIALLWTIPAGVAIGMNRRLSALLQPIVQVIASVPATALFPVFLLVLLRAPGGLNAAAIALMLMGTQWYLLFNVIAGAAAIPMDLRYTAALLRLSRWERWRTLILPSLFPYVITGAITASGGAWNASIVAEHVEFGGEAHSTVGVGALIAQATGTGDYALLLAGSLALIITVVTINRTFWRWLYRLAEERYRME